MKQKILALTILVLLASCKFSKQQTQKKSTQSTETSAPKSSPQASVLNEKIVVEKVKNHPISKSFTAGAILDSLAGSDGIVSWQLFKPDEYANDPDIIAVLGSCETTLLVSTISYKLAYLYQYSSEKIMFYAGLRGEKSINELQFIVDYDQKKLLE